ncbi:MAG: lipoate--protein ligase [Clostridiales bacterium]|nr:lipoate--protein ligase [Clostridiales bacterium]
MPEKSQLKGNIYISSSSNPWHNQAFEEMLLERDHQRQISFYLWRNERAVVIGRHQNAWKECDWQALEREGGRLARRVSGGGAVFHDAGNINFTFVMEKENYNLPGQLKVILRALRALGVEAVFAGRNDLEANGRKFSGNAFCHRKRNSLHHGTILLNADFGLLEKYLRASADKISSKGVPSLRSRVVNLRELQPSLTMERLKESLAAAFSAEYGGPEPQEVDTHKLSPPHLLEKFASWEWRLGASPACDVSYERRFAWGGVELLLCVSLGKITEARVFSDAMDGDFIAMLGDCLPGRRFLTEEIVAAWRGLDPDGAQKEQLEDVIAWFAGLFAGK